MRPSPPKMLPVHLLPALSLAAAILWLSLLDNPPAPPDVLASDKLQHALAYALLTWLLGIGLGSLPSRLLLHWPLAAMIAAGFGALVEVLQALFTTHRFAEWTDVAANTIGCLLVLLVVALWRKARPAAGRS